MKQMDEPVAKDFWLTGFYNIFTAQLFAYLTSCLTGFAVGLWIYTETQSVTLFSMSLIVSVLPNAIIPLLFSGTVDKLPATRVLVYSKVVSLLMAFLAIILLKADAMTVPVVLMIGAVGTACNSVFFLTLNKFIKQRCDEDFVPRANSFIAVMYALAEIVPPMVGGWLFQTYGLLVTFYLQAVFYIIAITILTRLAFKYKDYEESQPHHLAKELTMVWNNMKLGWHHIMEQRALKLILIVLVLHQISYAYCYVLLTPYFLTYVDADKYGVILGIGALGAFISSVILSFRKEKLNVRKVLITYALVCGLAGVILGVSRNPWVWTVSLFIYFLAQPLFSVALQSKWMLNLNHEVLARATSVRNFCMHVTATASFLLAPALTGVIFEPLVKHIDNAELTLVNNALAMPITLIGTAMVVTALIILGHTIFNRKVEALNNG